MAAARLIRPSVSRALRAFWRAGVGLVLAAAVLFGTVRSGARYYYCEALGLMARDPCVAVSSGTTQCPFQRLEQSPADCCQRITLPALPDGARASEPTIAPAAIASVLPAIGCPIVDPRAIPNARARWAEKWQRPPPSPAALRAQLMVFLT